MDDMNNKEFIIYGKQPVLEALRSNHVVKKLILARELDSKGIQTLLKLCHEKSIEVSYEDKSNLQRFCGPVLHQGIAAYLESYTYASYREVFNVLKNEEDPFILILDQIQDPHNLGAIIRTAEVAGVMAIILPEKGSAVITPTVAKTSAGAIFHCPVHRTPNLINIIQDLKSKNIRVIAMAPNRENTIFNSDLTKPIALVIGSEGKGVRKNIETICDEAISIPRLGKLDSLNASVSSAIVLFEAVRQRQYS